MEVVIRKMVDSLLVEIIGTGMKVNKTIHCQFRLLNILFSDEFVSDFYNSGNNETRHDLDSNNVGKSLTFGKMFTMHSNFFRA